MFHKHSINKNYKKESSTALGGRSAFFFVTFGNCIRPRPSMFTHIHPYLFTSIHAYPFPPYPSASIHTRSCISIPIHPKKRSTTMPPIFHPYVIIIPCIFHQYPSHIPQTFHVCSAHISSISYQYSANPLLLCYPHTIVMCRCIIGHESKVLSVRP